MKKYECIIGWSTGSQVALACTAKYPSICDTLFLLNLSTGLTLHTLFQLVLPLPMFLQRYASKVFTFLFRGVLRLVDTGVWDAWRKVAHSPYYRLVFGIFAFVGGFPPEMAIYFDEYNHEIFTSRTHTASLGKLILSLDEPCPFQNPAEAVKNVRKCVVFSGFFDFMTGVYLSNALCSAVNAGFIEGGASGSDIGEETSDEADETDDEKDECANSVNSISNDVDIATENSNLDQVPIMSTQYTTSPTRATLANHTGAKCEHTVFTMGSHFLLLEWPELVASGLCDLLSQNEQKVLGVK